MATSDLEIEGQGHKTIAFVALPIYTHIPNLKVLTKIFFKLSRPKGNLCGGGGGVTVLNPKYPRLSSGDTTSVPRGTLNEHELRANVFNKHHRDLYNHCLLPIPSYPYFSKAGEPQYENFQILDK